MAAVLRAADLAADELARLLADLSFPDGPRPRAWLEAVDGWSLDYWPGAGGEVLWYAAGQSPRPRPVRELLPALAGGRVFAPAGEVRWRVLPALGSRPCRTVYLGEDRPAVHVLNARDELADKSPRRNEYPLWGLLTQPSAAAARGPEWVELRIPHRFRYPVDAVPAGGRAAVKAIVETWTDPRGEPHFSRLVDLQAYSGE